MIRFFSYRSHGSSYPQTPPNSYTVDTGFYKWSALVAPTASHLDTQELISKLDSNLTQEEVEDDEADASVSETVDDEDLGRVGLNRDEVSGTEEAFELFRKQNEEFIQHMDSIDAEDESHVDSSHPENNLQGPGVNINVQDYLFDLHNENVVASNICQDMMADLVDTSQYQAYISELPNSCEEYRKMVSKFMFHQTYESPSFSQMKTNARKLSQPGGGVITASAQQCITDPLTTAMLTASLGPGGDVAGKPKIESDGGFRRRSIVDFEIPRFMPTDIDYREPLLASQRESQERNRYLKSVSQERTTPKTRLIPSESEQNIKLFDEWQDDEITDLTESVSVLFSESDDVDIDELRESLDEQKRRLEEEYGIDLEDAALSRTQDDSTAVPFGFEWDDQEFGGGFGEIDEAASGNLDDSMRDMSDDVLEGQVADTTINIQATRRWRVTNINGMEKRIDMKVLDPFKKVLSHGGFTRSGQTILVFSACYMPQKKREDYKYILENLFLYVISSLQQMITGDYVLVYLHGGADDSVTPSLNWLKKCYSHIEHRVRKHLQALYLVHPDFWVKTGLKLAKVHLSTNHI